MGAIQQQTEAEPDLELAERTLPAPLYQALLHIFAQDIKQVALVGGTALAGFYAAHRRSDDLDLFTAGGDYFEACVLAVKSLAQIGATFQSEFRTKQFYKTTCNLKDHSFTVDVVTDPNIFNVGRFHAAGGGVLVASLETILMMKGSTLVSRASEKDLFDLHWLFKYFKNFEFAEFIRLAEQIDGGANAEAMLYNVSTTQIKESACDFSLRGSKQRCSSAEIFEVISNFRKELIDNLQQYLEDKPSSHPLGKVIRALRKLED